MKLLLLANLIFLTVALEEDCPLDWEELAASKKCYYFARNPRLNYEAAAAWCNRNGAELFGEEGHATFNDVHAFIVEWLQKNDIGSGLWFTSGHRASAESDEFRWANGEKQVSGDYWINNDYKNTSYGDKLVYGHAGVGWGWTVSEHLNQHNFICQINKQNVYLIDTNARDHTFGTNETNPMKVKRGPYFTEQPVDTIWDEESVTDSVKLNCIARGNPAPTYTWYRIELNVSQPIDFGAGGSRFSLTGGILTINNPVDSEDNGNYQCSAQNEIGIIFSNIIEFKVGYLKDFSNTERKAVDATAYEGTSIPCHPLPAHSPEQLLFSWYKGRPANQIKPNLKPHIFSSFTGNLYFQSVTMDDDGKYYCIASSPAATSGPAQGGKTSAANPLLVQPGTSQDVNPVIVKSFPQAFPKSPRIGDKLRIECVAYGTGRLVYKWSRPDKPLPVNSYTADNGRVLIVPKVSFGEDGTYICTVSEQRATTEDQESIDIKLQYPPLFNPPLRDQHLDLGDSLILDCLARSPPSQEVTYKWFRNGKSLPDREHPNIRVDKTVKSRTLIIDDVRKEDAGMFQCRARNNAGTRYNTAEIRVLEFPPTFARQPVPEETYAADGSKVILLCKPDGAPKPVITWKKTDGGTPGTTLPNGNLQIEPVTLASQGEYECTATSLKDPNKKDTSKGRLIVVNKVQYATRPRPLSVPVGSSAVLECYATADPRLDLSYVWKFNGRKIDFNTEFYAYKLGFGQRLGSLHIVQTHFNMSGFYTCIAETVAESNPGVEARVDIIGPPGAPIGVVVDTTQTSAEGLVLHFKVPAENGASISEFEVWGKNPRMQDFEKMTARFDDPPPTDPDMTGRKLAIVTKLAPGSSYNLRVRARNVHGWGELSLDLGKYVGTSEAAPVVAPQDVSGGGGKVGTLTVNWTPLPEQHRGGKGMGYRVQQREYKPGTLSTINWDEKTVDGANANKITFRVGESKSFLDYEVRVQAFNNEGNGPWTPIENIKSAENLPQARPEDVWATPYNATAIRVYWNHVPIDQKNINGELQGFRINYWLQGDDIQVSRRATIFNPEATRGLIIGLHSDTYYYVAVMVYNDAGNGPPSEHFLQRTLKKPPQLGPLHVTADFYEGGLRIQWQGISTSIQEEPLEGYKVRVWSLGQNIREARDFDAGKNVNYVLKQGSGIGIGVVYNLRVFGYSLGGEGKMSSPVISFRLGNRAYIEQSGGLTYGSSTTQRISTALLVALIIRFFC